MGLLVNGNDEFMATHTAPPNVDSLTWSNFVWANLLPVTIGNIIGGALMVGVVYWFVYLRRRPDA
jgi:formate/nitrite transporter FocA (FNT family)